MKENTNYRRLYFLLNLCLAFIMFLNIIVIKRSVDYKLWFIIISYILIIGGVNILQNRKFKLDNTLNLIINLFVLLSLVILYRINPNISIKQCFFFIVGYIVYILILFFIKEVHKFYKLKWWYFGLSLIFMTLSYFFGEYINGSKNWISILGITFQPSEFGKIFIILYLASVLKDNRNKKNKYITVFLLVIIFLCLVLQKDLGIVLIILIISMLMYYIRTSKYKFLLSLIVLIGLSGIFSYFNFYHVRVRIHAWLNPESDPMGMTYQVLQGFFAMGSGGFLGKGLYQGNLDLIPVNYTDYIFVSIVEELGIITGILIVALYFLFFTIILKKALSIKKNDQSILGVLGFVMLISIQAIIILGGILNLIPLTGVTLPFISYGGSSLISMFVMFSLIQKFLEGDFIDE